MPRQATGTDERMTRLDLIDRHRQDERRITLGADKLFDGKGVSRLCGPRVQLY